MRRWLAIALAVVVALPLCGCVGGQDIEWEVSVYGDVGSPSAFSFQDLEAMGQGEVEKQLLKSTELYSGALLSEVFASVAPMGGADYVNFIADDGYILSFDIGDVEGGILALRRDGDYLDENSGPVMLALGIGCACNWMKHVQDIELYDVGDSLGIQGDLANPMYMTLRDIRAFTGKENDFSVGELFTKAAYYPQAQTFSVVTSNGIAHEYDIALIDSATVSFEDSVFSVKVGDDIHRDVDEIRSVWDPNS